MTYKQAQAVAELAKQEQEFWNPDDIEDIRFEGTGGREDWAAVVYFKSGSYVRIGDQDWQQLSAAGPSL